MVDQSTKEQVLKELEEEKQLEQLKMKECYVKIQAVLDEYGYDFDVIIGKPQIVLKNKS